MTRGESGNVPMAAARLRRRLCDADRLLGILDLGATLPCEKFLTVDELDLPELTFPPHLRLCELLTLDRPDLVLALPWNLETELTDQLSYIADWGGQLVFSLPSLHDATPLASNHIGMVLS
ncbi:hypothetical protein [Candidatus Mycobacterium methanotrophicum]|uniref:hypothetical protein n=1 Tax=Candidatus Mycobacterium methanotrophicum TaxID=2943498 RepID=UPI003511DB25